MNTANRADQANHYFNKYRPQVDALLKSPMLRGINESATYDHVVQLGKQLDAYSFYSTDISESGGLNSLGRLPEVALDVITASFGGSVIPLLASTQSIDEQRGTVYFRETRATSSTGGGFAEGDVIYSPLQAQKVGDGTLGAQRRQVVIGTGDGTLKEFSGNLPKPVRRYTVQVNVPGVGTGQDDGDGRILGFGFDGEIDYDAGTVKINSTAPVADGTNIEVRIDVDIDNAEEIPTITAGLVNKLIDAEIWTLGAEVGTFANLAAQRRFGRANDDMIAEELTNAMTDSLNIRVIKAVAASTKGKVVWNQKPDTAISLAEHKLSFIDAVAQAERNLHLNSGINTFNRYVCGSAAASVLRGMPGFVKTDSLNNSAVSLYGTLDGVPVIRAAGVVNDTSCHIVANPDDYFNAPVVYSPFFPLFMTDTVASEKNPFRGKRAAGVWAGISSMNENLVTEIEITPVTQFGS